MKNKGTRMLDVAQDNHYLSLYDRAGQKMITMNQSSLAAGNVRESRESREEDM